MAHARRTQAAWAILLVWTRRFLLRVEVGGGSSRFLFLHNCQIIRSHKFPRYPQSEKQWAEKTERERKREERNNGQDQWDGKTFTLHYLISRSKCLYLLCLSLCASFFRNTPGTVSSKIGIAFFVRQLSRCKVLTKIWSGILPPLYLWNPSIYE